jgi:hypothetical protein
MLRKLIFQNYSSMYNTGLTKDQIARVLQSKTASLPCSQHPGNESFHKPDESILHIRTP